MARIRWYTGELEVAGSPSLTSISADRTKAVYDFADAGRIVLLGEKLRAEPGEPDILGSGKVEKIILKADDGSTQLVAEGRFKAGEIGYVMNDSGFLGLDIAIMFAGDDVIYGSAHGQTIWGGAGDDEIRAGRGRDQIFGGSGSDHLWGGKGADTFNFYDDDSGDRDVIHDFDITGKDADGLFVNFDIERVRSINDRSDTLLELDTGSVIVIKDVKRGDFLDYWSLA